MMTALHLMIRKLKKRLKTATAIVKGNTMNRKRQIMKATGKYGKYYPKWLEAHEQNKDIQIPFTQMILWYRRCER